MKILKKYLALFITLALLVTAAIPMIALAVDEGEDPAPAEEPVQEEPAKVDSAPVNPPAEDPAPVNPPANEPPTVDPAPVDFAEPDALAIPVDITFPGVIAQPPIVNIPGVGDDDDTNTGGDNSTAEKVYRTAQVHCNAKGGGPIDVGTIEFNLIGNSWIPNIVCPHCKGTVTPFSNNSDNLNGNNINLSCPGNGPGQTTPPVEPPVINPPGIPDNELPTVIIPIPPDNGIPGITPPPGPFVPPIANPPIIVLPPVVPPVVEPPVVEPPVVEPPVVEPPVIEPPVVEPPAAEPPVLPFTAPPVPPAPAPAPAAPAPAAPAAPPAADDEVLIEDTPVPLTSPPATPADTGEVEPAPAPEFTIEDPIVPLAPGNIRTGSWALWNLILSIAGVALALLMAVRMVLKKRKDNEEEETEEDEKQKRSRLLMVLAIPLTAVLAVVLFILTQDMRLPMVMIDIWTLAHAILFAAGLLGYIFAYKNVKEDDEDEEAPAIA